MKAGPKAAVDESPLPWRPRSSGGARVVAFIEKFVVVPNGEGGSTSPWRRSWRTAGRRGWPGGPGAQLFTFGHDDDAA